VSAALIVLVIGTLIAAAIDVRSRRIPNVLTATMAATAIVLQLGDGTGVLLVLASMTAAFALGALAFSAGWLGGGDVKLIAAACGLAGYPGCVSLGTFILIAGAVLAIVQAVRQRRLVAFVQNASALAITGSAPRTPTLLPYAAAVSGGSTAYALSTLLPGLRLPL
jgi:prepilin peptidase CpaA